jgi:hypothetical protein
MSKAKTKAELKVQPKLIERRFVGLQVLAGGRSPPMAYVLYSEFYADGSTRSSRGRSITSMVTSGMLNGTGRQKKMAKQAYRPDLQPVIEAAAVLNHTLIDACLQLDDFHGYGEMKE